ncbi:T9SS type A sorting domain-containing protein [Flavobacterium sp.]|uniref:T9SS type A sorting domain-containing protein n=1 Tax=Flavobacterium sp. TaxID=239 RepID=UPI003D0E6F5F
MKTLFLSLLFTVSFLANNGTPSNTDAAISGLDIQTYKTKKLGTHIYIVSDFYAEKKVEFINQKGQVVYTKNTTGSPIQLSKLKPGNYLVKITENNKSAIIYYEVQ